MGLFDLFKLISLPFTCLRATGDEENQVGADNEKRESGEPLGEVEIPCKEIRLEDAEWPPKRHKAPFIAEMAEYWDQRIARIRKEEQEAIDRAKPKKLLLTKIECRNCISV